MDFFEKAKSVRLRNHHGKFLRASDDQLSVSQEREGTRDNTVWQVELVKGGFIRLKSCYNCYLKATNTLFILGATGKKVQQGRPYKLDRSVEWEPVKEAGSTGECKLKSYLGSYLRGNHGLPPWRNSITHDASLHRALQHTVSWEVQVVESVPRLDVGFEGFYKIPSPKGGRLVYFSICDSHGEVMDNGDAVWPQLNFKGQSITELTLKVKQETESKEDIVLCGKNPASEELYPLRLELPPNNAPMHVFVVRASSPAGKKLLAMKTTDEDSSYEDEASEQAEDEDGDGAIHNDEDVESLRSYSLDDRQEETNSSRFSSSSSEPLQIPPLDLPGR